VVWWCGLGRLVYVAFVVLVQREQAKKAVGAAAGKYFVRRCRPAGEWGEWENWENWENVGEFGRLATIVRGGVENSDCGHY